MHSKKQIFIYVLKQLAVIFFASILIFICMYHSSCTATSEGITLVTKEEDSPKITDINVKGEKLTVTFSKQVSVKEAFALEVIEGLDFTENLNVNQNKLSVDFEVKENLINFSITDETTVGNYYELYALCCDSANNSMTFTIPFCAENKNIPKVLISEISDNYVSKDKTVEYIELFALTSGNLFGLELKTASNNKTYILPNCEVQEGEYIVIHLRSVESPELCVSEIGTNLNQSKAVGSINDVRDIWINSTESALSPSAEIITLFNRQENKIVDCLLYSKQEYALGNDDWKSESLLAIAKSCKDQNLWGSDVTVKNSVYSLERKTITYISRKNINEIYTTGIYENDATHWIGTTKSKSSCGKANTW